MAIDITEALLKTDVDSGNYWQCWLKITDGVDTWMLPATAPGTLTINDLQAYFDAQENYLWGIATKKQHSISTGTTGAIEAKGGAKVWYTANPGALQIFELDGPDLEAAITALVALSFPSLTSQQKKQWEFLLISLAYNDRLLMRQTGLV